MGIEAGFCGCAPLKEGVTQKDVLNLYLEFDDREVMVDGDILDVGEGTIQVRHGQMEYDIYTTSSTYADQFREFLDAVAERIASAGWVSYDPQDNDEEQSYGPDERSALEAELALRKIDLSTAQERIVLLEHKLAELK